MNFKCEQNLLLLWIFFVIQLFVFLIYFKFSSTWNNDSSRQSEPLPQPVMFFSNKGSSKMSASDKYKTYYNSNDETEIYLKTENVENYFVTVNNAICFKFGTDIEYMKRNMKIMKQTGKCECLTGYHGNDCSLPEVIWRAFIAFRQETVINKRNSKARRIIHMFRVSHPAQIPLVVIKINELFEAVDLFIVIETNQTEYRESKPFYFKIKLDKGLLKDKQYKILYTPVYVGEKDSNSKNPCQISWEKSRNLIKNLRQDDLLFYLDSLELPNPKSLLFFKLYDGFSLPLQFRLKWNVYGYYFQHPNKTKRITTGSTVEALEKIYGNDPNLLDRSGGLVVGDLNHYGGWFCDLCYDPVSILNVIQTFNEFERLLSDNKKVVDVKYVEELLGDGLYVDGKTILLPNHQDRDTYYSPQYVADNFWKYDSLMINFYSKTDYN